MPPPHDDILLFGDSITQGGFEQERGFGFVAALAHAYVRRLDVVNRGFSGYNTRQALEILPHIIPSPEVARIRFLVLFFGANDAARPLAVRPQDRQHVPLDEYRVNLEKIVTHPLITTHTPRIILVTPAPVDERMQWVNDEAKGHPAVLRLAATTKAYADAVVDVGSKLHLPVVNLWTAFMEQAGWQADHWQPKEPLIGSAELEQNKVLLDLLYDGLHFAPAGYQIMFKETMSVIGKHWPDQLPENLPIVFPAWNDKEGWDEWHMLIASKAS